MALLQNPSSRLGQIDGTVEIARFKISRVRLPLAEESVERFFGGKNAISVAYS
jgi:hypothetical protein